MSRTRAHIEAEVTRQNTRLQQLLEAGAFDTYDDQDDSEPTWGTDPFCIIAHREEQGLSNDD